MINYDLKKIRAIFLDVDGVLSCETIPQHPNGDPMRTRALQLMAQAGITLVKEVMDDE